MEQGKYIESYKDLIFYPKAYNLSLTIHKLTTRFPKEEQYSLCDQIKRSSRSVCANIVEGFGRQRDSKKEFYRFLTIAIGSLDETNLWLDYSKDLNYITMEEYNKLQSNVLEIRKIMISFRSKLT